MEIILVLLIFIYSVALLGFEPTSVMNAISIWGLFGWGQLFFSIYSWKKQGNRIISPYVIFLICMYIFNFGQCLLYPFPVDFKDKELIGYLGITPIGLYKAELYTLMMLAGFHLGALFYIKNRKAKQKITWDFNSYRIRRIGLGLIVISIVPYYYSLIEDMIWSLSYGYGALYERDVKIGIDNLGSFFADYFIPACICLYVGYSNNRNIQRIIELLLLFNALVLFVTGGRTVGVIILGLLIVLYNYVYKAFSKKQVIMLCFSGFFFLSAMSVVAEFRVSSNRSLEAYSTKSVSSNKAILAIAEMGSSMSCLIKTREIISDTGELRYGSTYLYALTSIIPNLGFWDIHPAKAGANMSDWLTDKLGLTYGTGFSMTAEAYINFGFFCWIFMIFLGYILSWIFSYIEIGARVGNAPMVIFTLILFYFSLKMPRNNFLGIIRPFFFYALPIYFLCKDKSGRVLWGLKKHIK